MIRYVLHFCLCAPDDLSPDQTEEWYKEWTASLKPLTFWMTSLGDCRVDLTALGHEFLEFLQKARNEGAKLNSVGLEEELLDDAQTPVEWFVVHARGLDHLEKADDLVGVKADRIKPGVHLAGWFDIRVSERFKAVVEKHALTGVEFLWCPDTGKYQAPQWYLAICQKSLGRGLDHPWIDTKTFSGCGYQVIDPSGRHGQQGAFAKNLKPKAWSQDSLLVELLPVVKLMELLKRTPDFGSFQRYLRSHLPDTDFAYTIQDIGNGRGRPVFRHRGLAMNRKAMDLMKMNGIITDEQYEPVLILEEPPEGVENLDEKYGPAEPAFTPEQMAKLRELEAKAWAEHVAHPKPPRAPDLKRSLSLLRARKKQTPEDFATPASAKAIDETGKTLGRKLPAAWQQVLRVCNGGRIDKSPLAAGCACIIMPLKDLPQWQRSESKYYRGRGAELSDWMLFIIHTEIGDSIWLDTAKAKPDGDCRVVLMSHETGEEERDWPTVAEFLEEFLTETQEEED